MLPTLMTRQLATPLRRTRTLQLIARGDVGYVLRAAVTTAVLAITGGLECHLHELQLTWNRLRPLSSR